MKSVTERKVLFRRLHHIDEKLREKSYPNATKLAEDLGVSSRTIRRDIDEMKLFYNAPIEYDKTKNGYYYTQDSFYIKDIFLNESEIEAMRLLKPSFSLWKNTPVENILQLVFQKIINSLDSYNHSDNISGKITYIAGSQSKINKSVFSDIFKAVKEQKEISFAYRPLSKQSFLTRTIKPYHIICQRGNWYVIGFDYYKNDIRLFSFARIKQTEILNKTFAMPNDFDYHDWIDENVGVYASEKDIHKVRLLFAKEVAAFALSESFTENQIVEKREDGNVEVSFKTTQFSEILRFVLGQGSSVQVLEPKELIDAVKEQAANVLKMYS